MKRKETTRLVFGAMMLAIYGLLLVIDTYTGSLFNVLLYYVMPLPFVVYGLKYGLKMLGVLIVAGLCLNFLIALPSTIFLSISAMFVSLVLYIGISQKKDASVIFLATMFVSSLSQLLSMTLFAEVLGYDIAAEFAEIQKFVPLTTYQMTHYFLPLFVVIIGGLEAFVFVTFTDIVLLRLKMEKMTKFSLFTMHLSKKTGATIVGLWILSLVVPNSFIKMLGVLAFLVAVVQGLSFILYYHIIKRHSRLIYMLSLVGCIVPILNIFYAVVGLFDIFSEMRRKLLYNKANL